MMDIDTRRDIKDEYDCIVVGAGPAGLSSATTVMRNGAKDVLIIERDNAPGGILLQCIHTGFGLLEFNEELTGPEYAGRWLKSAVEAGVRILTETIVLSVGESADYWDERKRYKEVTISGLHTGIRRLKAKTVILAMGCRERTRGALGIPGTRPAGILTAGCAQRLVNIEGYMPGRKVLILGSGDIGLIMARRMTLEGADVVAVCEKMPKPGGLERNVQQCLVDFRIPLKLSCTITNIFGKKRVEAAEIAYFDENGDMKEDSREIIECDTILLSVGLIPENELSLQAGLVMDRRTGGPLLGEGLHTSAQGVYACGNVYKVYDLVDNVSLDSVVIGKKAAAYISGGEYKGNLRPEMEIDDEELEQVPGDGSRIMTCTVCPAGCRIKAAKDTEGNWSFEGYTCRRGLDFARSEVIDPVRVLTSTVLMRTVDSEAMIPVRTVRPIPLAVMFEAMDEIRKFVIDHVPVQGEIVIDDLAGTGIGLKVTGISKGQFGIGKEYNEQG